MNKDTFYYTSLYSRLSDDISGLSVSSSVVPVVSDFDYTLFQVQQYNSIQGSCNGYICPHCKNKNYIATINNSGDFALIPCYHGGK